MIISGRFVNSTWSTHAKERRQRVFMRNVGERFVIVGGAKQDESLFAMLRGSMGILYGSEKLVEILSFLFFF